MTIAYWCVLAAGLMPYLFTLVAKASGPRYDNSAPRQFLEGLTGRGQRANWAQLNSFEAFPLFAAAVIIAQLSGAAQDRVDFLAGSFVLARLVYGAAYIADKPTFRSLAWSVGIVCVIALFVASA
jgi:uncharacterized MAPEG superfamily protein